MDSYQQINKEINILVEAIKKRGLPRKLEKRPIYTPKYSKEELAEIVEDPEIEEDFFDPEIEYGIPLRGEF